MGDESTLSSAIFGFGLLVFVLYMVLDFDNGFLDATAEMIHLRFRSQNNKKKNLITRNDRNQKRK